MALGKCCYKIRLSQEAEDAVKRSRELVDNIIKEKKVVYGVTTGFGKFARTVISEDKLEELQLNVIRSHAAGVGSPLSAEKTRMLLALRVNVLAKGCSGISPDTLHQYIDAFNGK
uniref:Histidine ammonia-lyase n=1 Tax=Scylla olivacea TaxID=85551 RepID=A0A0N7Z9Q5_SCYOL